MVGVDFQCFFQVVKSPKVKDPEMNLSKMTEQASGANRWFDSYEHILESCCDAWNDFTSTVAAVRQLCSREWAMTEV